jgi:hypothetical protein
MNTFTFRINLRHVGNNFQTEAEKDTFATTKTIHLPVGHHGGTPFVTGKHGDTFTRNGAEGAYLKELAVSGQVFGIEFVE